MGAGWIWMVTFGHWWRRYVLLSMLYCYFVDDKAQGLRANKKYLHKSSLLELSSITDSFETICLYIHMNCSFLPSIVWRVYNSNLQLTNLLWDWTGVRTDGSNRWSSRDERGVGLGLWFSTRIARCLSTVRFPCLPSSNTQKATNTHLKNQSCRIRDDSNGL